MGVMMPKLSAPFLIPVFLAVCFITPRSSFGWGQPHLAITKAALETLPAWEKAKLGAELAPLGANYCLIPDNVFTDKENAKYAAMESLPGEVYVKKLHLPVPEQQGNLETVRYFMEKAVASLKAGSVSDAARYMGTLCHLIEDFGSPSHTIPGDNMFTLLQQFMPPTEKMDGQLLHGPIENGTFAISIDGYTPQLLGVSVHEASWRLLHRIHEGIINARSTTVPIIQALYADRPDEVTQHQMRAAVVEAQIVADAVHTILSLGEERLETAEKEALTHVGISAFWPLEAVNLYYPQTEFFSSPYWGHACSGYTLEGGTKRTPLKLRVGKDGGAGETLIEAGISVGMGKPLTWQLPKGVYARFVALAGLQAGLGNKGRVEFSVLGDGKVLASAIVKGDEPAHAFDCDITGVRELQLAAMSKGLDPKSNYAVWGDLTLRK
jgi:hypothetical protein